MRYKPCFIPGLCLHSEKEYDDAELKRITLMLADKQQQVYQ